MKNITSLTQFCSILLFFTGREQGFKYCKYHQQWENHIVLQGKETASCQREETLWRDKATGNIIGKEGKGEAASSSEEAQG